MKPNPYLSEPLEKSTLVSPFRFFPFKKGGWNRRSRRLIVISKVLRLVDLFDNCNAATPRFFGVRLRVASDESDPKNRWNLMSLVKNLGIWHPKCFRKKIIYQCIMPGIKTHFEEFSRLRFAFCGFASDHPRHLRCTRYVQAYSGAWASPLPAWKWTRRNHSDFTINAFNASNQI